MLNAQFNQNNAQIGLLGKNNTKIVQIGAKIVEINYFERYQVINDDLILLKSLDLIEKSRFS